MKPISSAMLGVALLSGSLTSPIYPASNSAPPPPWSLDINEFEDPIIIPFVPELTPSDSSSSEVIESCGTVNDTGAKAESAVFVHQAGLARYGRYTTMAEAAQRVPLTFGTLGDADGSYLSGPEAGMDNMEDPDGRSRIAMGFHIEKIDAQSFDPAQLVFHPGYDAEYIYAPSGALQQLLSEDTLSVITVLGSGEEGYTIQTYRRANQVGPKVQGLYTILPGEKPYLESKISNPTPGTYVDRIQVDVTERFKPGSEVFKQYHWTIDPADKGTTFEERHPKDPADPSVMHVWKRVIIDKTPGSGGAYEQIRTVFTAMTPAVGQGGAPILALTSRDAEVYKPAGGFKRIAQKRTAVTPTGANTSETITTDYTYFEGTNNPLLKGRPKTVVSTGGDWTVYDYTLNPATPNTLVYRKYTPFMNSPMDSLQNGRLETVVIQDGLESRTVSVAGTTTSSLTRTTQLVGNLLVVKRERSDGQGSQLTSFRTYGTHLADNLLSNRIHSEVLEDGTVVKYQYSLNALGGYTEIKEEGAGTFQSNGIVTAVLDGTRTITEYNEQSWAQSETTVDVMTGLTLTSWSATDPSSGVVHIDPFGRPLKKFHNGNVHDVEAWQYLCCGLLEGTSREGTITSIVRDPLGRVVSKSEARSSTDTPIVTRTSYLGLTTLTERSAGSYTELVQEVTLSLGGLSKTMWTPDADGKAHPSDSPISAYPKAERTFIQRTFLVGGGSKRSEELPDGNWIHQTYHADKSLSLIEDQAGFITLFGYGVHNLSGGGLWIRETSPVNTQWKQTYVDHLGREFRIAFSDGSFESLHYYDASAAPGSRGQLQRMEDCDETANPGSGHRTTYNYDARGRVNATHDAVADGHVRSTTLQQSVVPSATVQGLLIAPAYRSEERENGVLKSTTFRSGDGFTTGTTSLEGDQVTQKSTPADGSWEILTIRSHGAAFIESYAHGRLSNRASYLGTSIGSNPLHSTSLTYDSFGRIEATTDSRTGEIRVLQRRDNGNEALVVMNGGKDTFSFLHDSLGRIVTVNYPDRSQQFRSYNKRGHLEAVWGAQTYPEYRKYDALGRLAELRTYQDLAYGVKPTESTGGFARTQWLFDRTRGFLAEENYDGETGLGPGSSADYTYTKAGRIKTRTWERGVVTTYSYDQGMLESVVYTNDPTGTESIQYQYDSLGRLTMATQGGHTHTYTFDTNQQHLDKETIGYDTDGNGVADFTRTLDYKEDTFLRNTGFVLLNGSASEHETYVSYDAAGRVGSIAETTSTPSHTFQYKYLDQSRNLVQLIQGPAHSSSHQFEPHRDVLLSTDNRGGSGGNLVSRYAYRTNSLGQRTTLLTDGSAFSGAKKFQWTYNRQGDLIQANDQSSANDDRAYQYDGIGNRERSVNGLLSDISNPASSLGYAANGRNQYAGIGTLTPVFDLDGNPTSYPLPTSGSGMASIVWDAENRPVMMTVNGASVSFSYDLYGRQIRKQSSTGTDEWYLYDNWNRVAQYSNGSLKRKYTWGPDVTGTAMGAGGIGGLLAVEFEDKLYFPAYDGNGNICQYLDSSGAPVAHFEYDPFGSKTAEVLGSGAPQFLHQFSTKAFDSLTGLHDFGFRQYNARTGRWMGRDPIGELGHEAMQADASILFDERTITNGLAEGGLNPYAYVLNSPTNLVDRLGENPVILIRGVVQAVQAFLKTKTVLTGVGLGVGLAAGSGTSVAAPPADKTNVAGDASSSRLCGCIVPGGGSTTLNKDSMGFLSSVGYEATLSWTCSMISETQGKLFVSLEWNLWAYGPWRSSKGISTIKATAGCCFSVTAKGTVKAPFRSRTKSKTKEVCCPPMPNA